MPDGHATPVRDRLEKILLPLIAVPYVAFLCLKVAWGWFRFIVWANREEKRRS